MSVSRRKVKEIVARLKQREAIQIIDYAPQYLDSTLEVAREIHAHSIYADLPMDEDKLIRQLSASGNIASDRFFKLAVRNGVVLGGFYGCTLRVFFCDALTAKDMGWWVKSDYRGGAAAILLLDAFEQWAKEKNALKCMIGQSGVEDIDRTLKLFLNCGYQLTGYNTSKDIYYG